MCSGGSRGQAGKTIGTVLEKSSAVCEGSLRALPAATSAGRTHGKTASVWTDCAVGKICAARGTRLGHSQVRGADAV